MLTDVPGAALSESGPWPTSPSNRVLFHLIRGRGPCEVCRGTMWPFAQILLFKKRVEFDLQKLSTRNQGSLDKQRTPMLGQGKH